MKAIILSAGQGSRLLPLTEETPKCLLPLYNGMSGLSWQLSQLREAGISEVVVVTGFHAEKVEAELARQPMTTRTIYNPFYKVADNLGSVWLARGEMEGDFILINGDTLFTADVPRRLLAASREGISVTVSRKGGYDDDDMKVVESEGRLLEIGKKLQRADVNAESIGMICFRGAGVKTFRDAVDESMHVQEGLGRYYLSVIGALAAHGTVNVVEVPAGSWCETDFPADLEHAARALEGWSRGEAVVVPLKKPA